MNRKLWKKWFLVTTATIKKICILLFFGTCLVSVTEGHQQEVALIQKATFVNLDEKDLSVKEMIKIVERQTDYYFSFDRKQIDIEASFSVDAGEQKLESVLATMGAQTGLSYRMLNSSIHLRKNHMDKLKKRLSLLQETINGVVTDAELGETLPGVNVMIKGTTTGTSTDSEGSFELEVPSLQDTLVVTFVGYQSREVPINGRMEINIELTPQAIMGEEMVVVGYGTAMRKDVTGSIGSIDVAEANESATFDNVGQLFQGHVPGLHANIATGAGGTTSLQIRGQNSINATNSPLLVIDGMTYYGNISDLNPNDIQSVDVLKGASAAAVYGASAAAGVVEITTKQGTSPEPTINFNSSIGLATADQASQPFGPEGYLQMREDMATRQFPNQPEYYYSDPRDLPSDITMEEWKALGTGGGEPVETWLNRMGLAANEIDNFMAGKTIDWYDQVYNKAAPRQNYNLSVSGQTDPFSYYWSFGYVNNEGEVAGERVQTLRSRLNLETTVADRVRLSLHSQYSNRGGSALDANEGYVRYASPYGDKYTSDGELVWLPHGDEAAYNPFLWTEESGRKYNWDLTNLIANIQAELLDLPFGIGYKVRWTNRMYFHRGYNFIPSTIPQGEPAGTASRSENTDYSWQVDNILTWDRTFADIHAFDATFLFNVEVHNDWHTSASSEQFPLEVLDYGNLPLGTNPSVGSDDNRSTGTALMGRLNYRLLDRYLFTFSYRRDGYSAFGESNPYAYFPSAAFAWRLTEEPFFNVDPVSNLKLRFSWGMNGNRDIGNYPSLQRLGTNKYLYGTEVVTGIWSENLPNRNLKWEQTEQYNIGLDFALLDDRFSGMIDAYYMSTTNMLLERSLPELSGYSSVWSNLGEVVNRGFEMSLNSTNIRGEHFNWTSTLNFSLNRNEVKHLYGTMVPVTDDEGNIIGEREADDRQNGWFIGRSLHQIYDYEVLGVWQQDEAEQAAQYGFEPGDFKLRDVNGDGVLTPIEDKVFQGYTDPRYRISLINNFNYKNFDVSFMLTSRLGHYASHNDHKHTGWQYGRGNQYDYPYWTPDNPTNEWARLSSVGDAPDFNYWERTSFVKLQNLSVGYIVPMSLIDRLNVKQLRFYFNARNVYALSSWDGYNDPETHGPAPRVFSLGVNLSF